MVTNRGGPEQLLSPRGTATAMDSSIESVDVTGRGATIARFPLMTDAVEKVPFANEQIFLEALVR